MMPILPSPIWKYSTNRIVIVLLGTIFLLISLTEFPAEGKKRRSRPYSPLKILEVTTSPSPFVVGRGMLEFSIVLALPKNLNGANVLEVNSLISFPSKRSVRFVSHRTSIGSSTKVQGNSTFNAKLVWDGKDQSQQLVHSGQYHYEIRAKLMADEGYGPRTKIISIRSRGTINVTDPDQSEQEVESEKMSEPKEVETDTGQEELKTEEAGIEDIAVESIEEGGSDLEQGSDEALDMEEEGLEPTEELVSPQED